AHQPTCDVTTFTSGSCEISFASSREIGGLRRDGHVSSVPSQISASDTGRLKMKKLVGPADSRSFATLALIPCTAAESVTTTNTPTATPRIVRAARTRFDLIA